jgi:hypothetical protein
MAPPVWKIGDVPTLYCVFLSALNATLTKRPIPVNAGLRAGLINGRRHESEGDGFGSNSRMSPNGVCSPMKLIVNATVAEVTPTGRHAMYLYVARPAEALLRHCNGNA